MQLHYWIENWTPGTFFHALACTLKTSGPCIIHMLVITIDPPCKPPTFCFDFTVHQREASPAEGKKQVWTCFWEGSYSDTRQGGGKPRGACITRSNAQVAGRISLHEGSICSKQKLTVLSTLNHMEVKSQVGSMNGWRPGDIYYWLPNSTGKMFPERSVEPGTQSWSTIIKAE